MRVLRLGATDRLAVEQKVYRRREKSGEEDPPVTLGPVVAEEKPNPVVVPATLVPAQPAPAEPVKEQAIPYDSGGMVGVVTPRQAAEMAGGMPWGLIALGALGFLALSSRS